MEAVLRGLASIRTPDTSILGTLLGLGGIASEKCVTNSEQFETQAVPPLVFVDL